MTVSADATSTQALRSPVTELKQARVARLLRERIGRGEFRDGERLSMRGLAAEYGVSSSVACSALYELSREHLVDQDAMRRQFRVTTSMTGHDPCAVVPGHLKGRVMSGDLPEPCGRLRDLGARLARVEAVIETAKMLLSGHSGDIEEALIRLDACDGEEETHLNHETIAPQEWSNSCNCPIKNSFLKSQYP